MTRRGRELVNAPIGWQSVIHGSSSALRRAVFEFLVQRGKIKTAFRYAFCGCGDKLRANPDGVTLAPRGCGHRFCPRCGCRSGKRHVRRILKHLARAPHGRLIAFCMTQRVRKGESFVDARARLLPRLESWRRTARANGGVAGQLSHHVVWSHEAEGWHYHIHTLTEFANDDVTCATVRRWYDDLRSPDEPHSAETSSRLIAERGPAIRALESDEGEMHMWTESSDAVARMVQYPVRDIAQGFSAQKLGADGLSLDNAVGELVVALHGKRLHETWGTWREPPPEDPSDTVTDAEKPGEDAKPAVCPGPTRDLGTVHRLMRQALGGDVTARAAFVLLEKSVRNDSDFAKRLVSFIRKIVPDGHAVRKEVTHERSVRTQPVEDG